MTEFDELIRCLDDIADAETYIGDNNEKHVCAQAIRWLQHYRDGVERLSSPVSMATNETPHEIKCRIEFARQLQEGPKDE